MMPATAVTPKEAGTPAAAREFCGDSQQKSLKWQKLNPLILSIYAKSADAYTQYRLNPIPLILSII